MNRIKQLFSGKKDTRPTFLNEKESHSISKADTNRIYDFIKELELVDISFFKGQDLGEKKFEIIYSENSKLVFQVNRISDSLSFGEYRIRYTEFNDDFRNFPESYDKDEEGYYPTEVYIEGIPFVKGIRIDEVCEHLGKWIRYEVSQYHRELNTIDKWNSLKTNSQSINLINFDDFEQFSIEEKKIAVSGIEELKTRIGKHFTLTEKELSEIHSKLNYLIERTDKLNKFDWKGTTLNVILSIITNLSFDTQQGAQLWGFVKSVFSNKLIS